MFIDPNDWEFVLDYPPFHVGINKIGGGTVGKAYEGDWEFEFANYISGQSTGGSDFHTGTPKTHEEAAHLVIEFLVGE